MVGADQGVLREVQLDPGLRDLQQEVTEVDLDLRREVMRENLAVQGTRDFNLHVFTNTSIIGPTVLAMSDFQKTELV